MITLQNIVNPNKNPSDVETAQNFLNNYRQEKQEVLSRLNYNALTVSKNPNMSDVNIDDFMEKFKELNLSLEPIDNSVSVDTSAIDFKIDALQSYNSVQRLINLKFSLLDVGYIFRNSAELCRIRNLIGIDKFPTILVNSYKYMMLNDFYKSIRSDQEPKDIMYKIFILTIVAVVGSTDVCESLTRSDIDRCLELLKQPPDLEFCKIWMDAHEFAYLIHNVNDDCCFIFNNNFIQSKLYIHFEFYSKQLVVLKKSYRNQPLLTNTDT
ncbi:hypothetical protein PvNV_027 [Penaeus vannamei nudivirus]|nr:hypothetical protein PvSNPV_027 [Penaeus vannamei nucleopolyhedrovirus]